MFTPEQLAMSENNLLAGVRKIAGMRGWLTYHTHRSERSEPGFPDLCMVKGDRLLFVELKSTKGVVTSAQQAWLLALEAVPSVEVAVWRPVDLLDGSVAAVLSMPTGRHG